MRTDQHPNTRQRLLSLRTRIALITAVLIMATGALVLGSVYVYMRFAPDYLLVPQTNATWTQDASTPGASPSPGEPTVSLAPSSTASQVPSAPATKQPSTGTTASKKVPITSVSQIWSTLLTISVIMFIVLSVLGAVAAWLVAGRQLRPLRRLADEVAATSADTLASPIAMAGPMDEVRVLAESINAMKARLNDSFAALRRFTSNASHELKTPLVASQALVDVALDEPPGKPDDPQTRRQLLRQLRALSSQSLTTLDALLDLAEVTSVPLQLEPVNVSDLVADVVANLAPLAAAKGVTLTSPAGLDGQPGDVLVDADRPLLASMTRNLVANAIQYNIADGQVIITVETRPDAVIVRVDNDGAVLTDAQVARLAEPFYRVAGRVNSDADRGHGLGLPLAKAVAQAHGGRLDIVARPEGGLTVAVRLPAK